MTRRILIAGGGVVGSTLAVTLARAGARVTLADPVAPGANASGVAAGMLAPVFESLFDPGADDVERLLAARDLWPNFAASVGISLDRTGAVAVGSDDDLDDWAARLSDAGLAAARLSPAAARARLPGLADGLGGLGTGGDWRLDPIAALGALRAAGQALGIRRLSLAVTAFAGGRAMTDTGDVIDADALIIATGASRSLSGIAPELTGLTPIKGHILRAPDLIFAGPTVRFAGGYVCPDPAGAIIGATMEAGRSDPAIDPAQIERVRDAAARVLPAIARARLTASAGVRAATADRRPMVGRSATPGVWLAVGVRRNGWLLAPTVAAAVTRELMSAS